MLVRQTREREHREPVRHESPRAPLREHRADRQNSRAVSSEPIPTALPTTAEALALSPAVYAATAFSGCGPKNAIPSDAPITIIRSRGSRTCPRTRTGRRSREKAEARINISLARLSSRISWMRILIRAWPPLVVHPAPPESMSVYLTHIRTDSVPYPDCSATVP